MREVPGLAPDRAPGRLAGLGLALLTLHAVLLAVLEPIPPVHNGYSVPSYLLGNGAALLIAWAVLRRGPEWLTPHADRLGVAPSRAAAVLGIAAALAGALALRAAAPGVYYDFWREEGLFEPITLLAYSSGAALLWAGSGRWAAEAGRRPWRLAAFAFLFLALEEVDYFGIFGGLIGRIEGEYAGSLHDVIRLSALGLLGPVAYGVMIGIALGAAYLLWRGGWLRPAWLVDQARRSEALWVLAAALFLAIAAAEEAALFGWVAAQPTPEEAVEMAGGLCLAMWAVESAAHIARDFRAAGGADLLVANPDVILAANPGASTDR